MEKQYKYSLQKGSSKSICPECGKKTFVCYVDNITGERCPPQYGRCDREVKCGYHNRPPRETDYKPFNTYKVFAPKPKPQPLRPIPFEVLADTLNDYENNEFIQNLLQRVAFPFDPCDIEAVISQYYLGTVADWGGAVALPYIDIKNNIRAIQVKRFDQANHTTKTTFLHSILKYKFEQQGQALPDWLAAYELNETKVSCLFGEHLLNKYPLNPIALVEAPKSAIYGTLYFGLPNVPGRFLWLAVYNLSSLNILKCKALEGRDVVLFPDLSTDGKAFDLWNSKLDKLNTIKGARFTISNLLELNANQAEREEGCDIADYLICKDWRSFRESVLIEGKPTQYARAREGEQPLLSEKSEKSELETKHFLCAPSLLQQDYRPKPKVNWNNEIAELEKFFEAVDLPTSPTKLNNCSNIIDLPLFIESHLATVKAQNGQTIYLPYLERLQTLKQILEK